MSRTWTSESLTSLQRSGVFYLRGAGMTRLDTFVDAAFAFAVTLVVISIDAIPTSYESFIDALKQAPVFVACFFQIVMFWLGHRAWSQRFGLENAGSVWTSLSLVAGILIIVYPLKVVFSAGLGVFLPSPYNFNLEQTRVMFVSYGAGFAVMCGLIASLFWQALRHQHQLALTARELTATRSDLVAWLVLSSAGVSSLLVALFAEARWIAMAGYVYALLAIVMPLHAYIESKLIVKIPK